MTTPKTHMHFCPECKKPYPHTVGEPCYHPTTRECEGCYLKAQGHSHKTLFSPEAH